ncbi:MAG: hypothetical protein M1828_000651 [Chrysothrix sp. TS-e1954]|nr:MAG: hypothetical protein M1828_000651 [Chrysothrix sp. TS-e1954]
MALAMLPTIGMTISICLAQQLCGFNRHVWDIPVPQLPLSRKIVFAIELQYVWATGLIKISILLFYNRLAAGILGQKFIWFVRILIAFVTGYIITFTFTLFFTTRPFNAFWNQVNPVWEANHSYSAVSESSIILAASAFSIVQDFLVAGTPTLLFYRLQIPFKQKCALGAIFIIGFFLCIAGVLRIVYIRRIFFDTYDVTWQTQDVWAWTAVETLIGTIVASAPALKVLFRRYFYVFAYTYGSNSPSRRYSLHRSRDRDDSVASNRQFDATVANDETTKQITLPNRFSLPSTRKSQQYHVSGPALAPLTPTTAITAAQASGIPRGKRHSTPWTELVLDEDEPTPPGYVRVNVGPNGETVLPSGDEKDKQISTPQATHQKTVYGHSPSSSTKWLNEDMEMGTIPVERRDSPGLAF